jgi:cation transport ATPase
MDETERLRRASEWAAHFSPFWGYHPAWVGTIAALVSSITLAIFLGVAGVEFGQFWFAELVTLMSMFLVGFWAARISNREAAKAFSAEYRRLGSDDAAPH